MICTVTSCQLLFWCHIFIVEILISKSHGKCSSRNQVTVNPQVLHAFHLSKNQRDGVCLWKTLYSNLECSRSTHYFSAVQTLPILRCYRMCNSAACFNWVSDASHKWITSGNLVFVLIFHCLPSKGNNRNICSKDYCSIYSHSEVKMFG